MLHSSHTEDDAGLHFSAISFLLPVYLAEGAGTSVESPVVTTCLCVCWQDAVGDSPVELPGCSGTLVILDERPPHLYKQALRTPHPYVRSSISETCLDT